MPTWEELSQQGERRPGGVNDKAEEVILKAREKEDPDKVPYHPGLQTVGVKNGKIDLQEFTERERRARPEVIDGNSILQSSEAAMEFAKSAAEPPRDREETQPDIKKTKEKKELKPDLEGASYSKRLSYFRIEEVKAREILDSLFSTDGFYEEHYRIGKLKFTLRTSRGEPLNYIFSKLSGWNKMSPDGQSVTDEYMHQKNMYLMAVLLTSCNGHVFLDKEGRKTPEGIEATRDFVTSLPDVVARMMVEKMIDFEAVIKIVTGEGCESFF